MKLSNLYHTFVSSTDEKITETQIKEIEEETKKMTEDECKEMLMLMVEHSRFVENISIDDICSTIPYKGQQKDNNVEFDINNIPDSLKVILWKFCMRIKK